MQQAIKKILSQPVFGLVKWRMDQGYEYQSVSVVEGNIFFQMTKAVTSFGCVPLLT